MIKDELIWMGKRSFTQKARKNTFSDVSVRKSIVNGKTKARFIFRNGVGEMVSETDYIQFAVVDDKKLYFMTGDENTGLKMTIQDTPNRYVQINKECDAEVLLPFVGDYMLKYDQECGLYNISK